MLNDIFSKIDSLYPEMIDIRRYLHQHPELSFKEEKTAAYIAAFYEQLGIPYQTKIGGNGVIATLKGGKPGKTVALRADFDALPIQDEKNVDYKSTIPGVMHACGHDGHTATLLILAKAVQAHLENISGTIVFLHQHAEELAPGGAKPIIDSGALDHVDAVFGTHLWATFPVGTLKTSKAACMAGADRFEITIQGQGGHGGYPHETKDAVVIGAEVVSALQKLISRRIDPLETAVLTIGAFTAGNAFNIIADKATLIGTVRYLKKPIQNQIIEQMKKVIDGVCSGYDATYTIDYLKGYPPLINSEAESKLVIEGSKQIVEIKVRDGEMVPMMAGEDFAYYTLEKPGAYFFTGAQLEGHSYPHHHPKFDIDERALPIAAKTLISSYFAYQQANQI